MIEKTQIHNHISCAQVHELPQRHCGNNWEGAYVYLYPFICYLSVFLSVCLSINLSIYLYVCTNTYNLGWETKRDICGSQSFIRHNLYTNVQNLCLSINKKKIYIKYKLHQQTSIHTVFFYTLQCITFLLTAALSDEGMKIV